METNAPSIIMPEVILYKTLNTIFKLVKDDFEASTNHEQTILWDIFGRDINGDLLNFEEFNYFEQAKETFVKKSPSVNMGYNLEVANLGSVHILLPAESGQPTTLGADEDGNNYIYNAAAPDVATDFKPIFTQKYEATYNMLITSENTFEVILIYNLLKASLLALNSHLEMYGLMLPKPSGQDLNIQTDLVPTHIFHRSLMLNFIYEVNVSGFFYRKLVKKFKITGEMVNSIP